MISRRLRTAACVFLATTALSLPSVAHAQSVSEMPGPPVYSAVDANGVDLSSGKLMISHTFASIGPSDGGLAHVYPGSWQWNNQWGEIIETEWNYNGQPLLLVKVSIDGRSAVFWRHRDYPSIGPYLATTGQSLAYDWATKIYTHTDVDGTVTVFSIPTTYTVPMIASRVFPNGEKVTYTYEPCAVGEQGCVPNRLLAVTSSRGYMLKYEYSGYLLSKITALNTAVDACSPLAQTCNFTENWSSTSLSGSMGASFTATDNLNRTTSYTLTGGKITKIQSPTGATQSIAYDANGRVQSVTRGGSTWTYNYLPTGSGQVTSATMTDPLGKTKIVLTDATTGRATSSKDELNRETNFTIDTSTGDIDAIVYPEGNKVEYTRDADRRITAWTYVPKPNSGLSNIQVTAAYNDCSSKKVCRKPTSVTDARGNTTTFTYDATHGGVLTVTPPSPATGVQPQTRYSYSQVTSASGDPVYMLTGVAACPSGSTSCTSSNEVKTNTAYNASLLPTSITSGTTSTALRATTAMTYDARGNVLTVDGSLTGTADTTKYRYDDADQLIGVASPDPDGGGTLNHRASRVTYRADGQVSKRETGTVNSQTDAAWNNFASLQTVDVTFDTHSRPNRQTVKGGTTTYAITQTSYDALGRVDCTAVRMNLTGTIPASACTQSTGSPDRVTQLVYDAAGQVTQQKVGVGTAAAAIERSLTYTDNGQVGSLKDGNNNVTAYSYDGFDRLYTTTYSDGTFERNVAYDANGNVTSYRNRAAQTTSFTYDKLNRVTFKNAPGTVSDVTYDYDNLGRLTSASQPGTALSFTYDALSRKINQTGPQGTVKSDWDLAGRRTKITYPGSGLYVGTDYLVTGEVSKIRENGATSGVGVLASYGYDNLGARTSIAYGNGTSRSYAYDPMSRLTSMSLSGLSDSSANLVIDTITYNPASQIISQDRSARYAWPGYSSVTRTHAVNNLNQVTQTSSSGQPTPISFGYDQKGNLTSDGTNTFTYDAENRLISMGGSSSATLSYDPMGRLKEATASGATTGFAYDGIKLIAEYDGTGTLQRRYVHGPGIDEPIVHYEGAGTADRRWLYADERGSVMAVADALGHVIATNSYDEYGNPPLDTGFNNLNTGRFQYTGQAWLPEVGLYYYKNRLYSPWLGRFMQTDPIGYEDNANLYAYVSNDPINLIDPLGLSGWCGGVWADVCGRRDPGSTYTDCRSGNCTITTVPQPNIPEDLAPYGFGAPSWQDVVRSLGTGLAKKANDTTEGAKKRTRCAASAIAKNGLSGVLNGLGLIPGASTATVLLQLGAGGASLIYSAANGDGTGMALSAGSYKATSAKIWAEQSKNTSKLAKIIPGLGTALSAAALYRDARQAVRDYKSCMATN